MNKIMQLLASSDLGPNEARALVEKLPKAALPQACLLLVNRARRLQAEVQDAQKAQARAEATLVELKQPPWVPGTVLVTRADGRLEVLAMGRRQVVSVSELPVDQLTPGSEVFLNRDTSVVVARNESGAPLGRVATVVEKVNGTLLIEGSGDAEEAVLCAPELASRLQVGDRVLCTFDFPFVLDRLPPKADTRYTLEAPPEIRFEDIGGLDEITAEIRRDLDLFLRHREALTAFGLEVPRGCLFVGPPGIGKTMLAGATAHYALRSGRAVSFMNVRPGELRSKWYGDSERRIREMFAVARAASGLVIIFLDELDSYGVRGSGMVHAADDRVLGALLTEISGLGSADDVLVIGATNLLTNCDPALIRAGRLGERIYRIPRPGREASQAILGKYLTPELPYAATGPGAEAATEIIAQAVSYLYAPNGGAGPLATVTFANSGLYEVRARDVLSGALLCSAVASAKRAAAHRYLESGVGIEPADLLEALDTALLAEAAKLTAPQMARQILDIPRAEEIVRVELLEGRRLAPHRHLRAA